MNWNSRKWSMKTKLLLLLIIFIFSIFFFASRGHAEETVGGHIQEAVFDTLAGAAAVAGAIEQAATGNFYTRAILTTLAGREFYEAYYEARAAWNLYYSTNEGYCNDRDINPAEANLDHGRD